MITLPKIAAYAQTHPDKTAVVAGHRCLSWRELHTHAANRIAYLLSRSHGELPRQACYISNNRLDLIPWLAAFATLSIPVVGLDYTLPLPMLQVMAERVAADFVLISSQQLALSGEMPIFGRSATANGMLIDLDSLGIGYIDVIGNDIRARQGAAVPPAPPFRSISLTSGTSGPPKVVLRSRSFDQRRFQYFSERYGFNDSDRFLVGMPLYHAAGNGWARLFLSLGATLYLANGGAELVRQMRENAITATVLSPVLLTGILKQLRRNETLPALRWVLVGGRNFTPIEKQRALQQLGPVLYEYYGTTESGVNTVAEPADLASYPSSVGRAYDGNEIAIVDHRGRRLESGQVGTVCIASYMNMDDYIDGGAEFLTLEDGQRYFVTPDQGSLDDAGRLYLLNRAGVSTVQAPLYRLENALRELPCIDDVAFLQRGTTVRCAYTIRPEGQDGEGLRWRITRAANDESIELADCRRVERIPYSPGGKVRVKDLEEVLSAV